MPVIFATVITNPPADVGVVWNSNDIITLRAAIASGVLTVSFTGPPQRSVTYQSLAAMQGLLAVMVRDVYGSGKRYRRALVRKGFRDDDTE